MVGKVKSGTQKVRLKSYIFFIRFFLLKLSRKMLTDVVRVMVNNSFKENFYREKKNNVLTTFSISHKNGVKLFLK